MGPEAWTPYGSCEHMGTLGDTLGALLSFCDMELEVCGTPSDELVAALAENATKLHSPFQSI